ncbi:MAG: TIGR04283 family arsenosugar biosynthesis glycosyltransferase [Anaerolineae bacterium]|nr:TIGR04283 family arsenosugar biosynthesis glycosyltransferase [Anaerolineae bacterium]
MLVSVIIPSLNEAETIRQCLLAARRDYPPTTVELIVVDGGSRDGTPDLAAGEARVIHSPRGRATQMNRGAAKASGDVLVFCHADVQLPAGWREAVLAALQGHGVSGGAFQIAYHPPKGILHWVNRTTFRGRWIAVHGDRAQFMARETLDAIGGFPDIPLMEDVEMARALHERGRIAMVPERVIASSRRYLEQGPLRQYALSVWLVFRYLVLKATPDDIARAYRSSRERIAVQRGQRGASIEDARRAQ